jgi:hypothetical protein
MEPTSSHRAQLKELASALREAHKTLIELVRREYEYANGRVGGSGEMLNLVLHDETFAWIRPLSGLIVEVDELADRDEAVTEKEAGLVRARIEKLITTEDPRGFGSRYIELLASEPKLAMSHFTVRTALGELPKR